MSIWIPPYLFFPFIIELSLQHRALLLWCLDLYKTCLQKAQGAAVLLWPLLLANMWLPFFVCPQGWVPAHGDGASVGKPTVSGSTQPLFCRKQWAFAEEACFYFFSEGIQCYSVESSLQVEFLGSRAVVCLHLKIWLFIWKQTWASSSSFIQAVLSQGQGVRPAQLKCCSQLLTVSK